MTLARDLIWSNVRPISAEEEVRVLRRFNAIEQCFGVPGWAGFDDVEAPKRERVTITCGRCGQPHTYLTGITAARRKYCDGCVRT